MQIIDTIDIGLYIQHVFSAKTPTSSYQCKLASICSAVKFNQGHHQSRKNRRRSKKEKQIKQDKKCLIPITLLPKHQSTNLMDMNFTFVDGGNSGASIIQPPKSKRPL